MDQQLDRCLGCPPLPPAKHATNTELHPLFYYSSFSLYPRVTAHKFLYCAIDNTHRVLDTTQPRCTLFEKPRESVPSTLSLWKRVRHTLTAHMTVSVTLERDMLSRSTPFTFRAVIVDVARGNVTVTRDQCRGVVAPHCNARNTCCSHRTYRLGDKLLL